LLRAQAVKCNVKWKWYLLRYHNTLNEVFFNKKLTLFLCASSPTHPSQFVKKDLLSLQKQQGVFSHHDKGLAFPIEATRCVSHHEKALAFPIETTRCVSYHGPPIFTLILGQLLTCCKKGYN
jgi:hypothetical protein